MFSLEVSLEINIQLSGVAFTSSSSLSEIFLILFESFCQKSGAFIMLFYWALLKPTSGAGWASRAHREKKAMEVHLKFLDSQFLWLERKFYLPLYFRCLCLLLQPPLWDRLGTKIWRQGVGVEKMGNFSHSLWVVAKRREHLLGFPLHSVTHFWFSGCLEPRPGNTRRKMGNLPPVQGYLNSYLLTYSSCLHILFWVHK